MKIGRTIATLLNHIPYISLVRVVISDLIFLSKDLSIWYAMKSRVVQGSDSSDASTDHLYISLLEETIEMIDWTKFDTDDREVRESFSSDTGKPEYIIQVPNAPSSIKNLQWLSLVILEHLLTLNKGGRICPAYTMCIIIEEIDPTNYFP